MKVLAVIPARYESSRFPGKMLADLMGSPILLHTVKQAMKAEKLDQVLVATDDKRIFDVVSEAGFQVCMTSKDHQSGTDRIAEAVKNIDVDLVVNVQGDEPFINPKVIDRLIERMRGKDSPDMATACTAIHSIEELRASSVVKVVRDIHECALYFSRSVIPFSRDMDPESLLGKGVYFRHLGIYAYRKTFLTKWETYPAHLLELHEKLEQLRALAQGDKIAVIETEQLAPGIDTPEDLQHARTYLTQLPETPL